MKKYSKYIILAVIIIASFVTMCFVPISVSKLIPVVESQIESELGVKVHLDKLILRIGPEIKLKSPIVHVMYKNNEKFAQLNNVKILIPLKSVFTHEIAINKLAVGNCIVRLNSDSKELTNLSEVFKKKDLEDLPVLNLKSYDINYNDKTSEDIYNIKGNDLYVSKSFGYRNFKVSTLGDLYIDGTKYISYDVSFDPKVNIEDLDFNNRNIFELIKQLKILDFHSDIIADVKLTKSLNGNFNTSGLINIDNISVLNIDKKSPKSFIYLTFLGEKIGVYSNVYTSLNKKIFIEGVLNNSKKFSVDLKVKSDEVDLKDLYEKLKFLVNCSKFKDIESLDGILVADFNLKGDINKIKSTGFLKVKEATVKAGGLSLENINSEIDFSNNVININKAIGYVKGAPITAKGRIDKNVNLELIMDKVELKGFIPQVYGVKSGIVSLIVNVTGNFDNLMHKENVLIENCKVKNKNFDLSFANLKLDTNKESIAYINNLQLKNPHTALIKMPSLKLKVLKDKIVLSDTNIFMPNSKIVVNAIVNDYNTKNEVFDVNFDGFINSRDIVSLNSYNANYPVKCVINGSKSAQNINLQVLMDNIKILEEASVVNLASHLENKNLRIDDLSIHSYNGTFSKNLKSNIKGNKKAILSGSVILNKIPELKNIRLIIPQATSVNILDTAMSFKGDVLVNGYATKPDVVGEISIQHLINHNFKTSIENTNIVFNKSGVTINSPNVKIADSIFGINANAELGKNIIVKNAQIKAKNLNIDDLLQYKKLLPLDKIPVQFDGKLYSERSSVTIYGSPLVFTGMSSDFNYKSYILTMKNLTTEVYNGKLAGNIKYDLNKDEFNAQIQARGISAAPVFSIASSIKDNISGTMDFDSNLTGNLNSKQSLLGDVKFIVHNGCMSSLGKLEHLLYAQNIIADNMLRTSLSVITKAITLKDTGLFKYLRASVVIDKGVASIKMLQSQGPLMSLLIKGSYHLPTNYTKLVVLGRLSDEVVSGLGAFGDFSFNKFLIMLTGEDARYNILPEDIDNLPQLSVKNTKEFRAVINGIVDKPSSVQLFNWISYSQKSYRQKEVPMSNEKVPDFVDALPY